MSGLIKLVRSFYILKRIRLTSYANYAISDKFKYLKTLLSQLTLFSHSVLEVALQYSPSLV